VACYCHGLADFSPLLNSKFLHARHRTIRSFPIEPVSCLDMLCKYRQEQHLMSWSGRPLARKRLQPCQKILVSYNKGKIAHVKTRSVDPTAVPSPRERLTYHAVTTSTTKCTRIVRTTARSKIIHLGQRQISLPLC